MKDTNKKDIKVGDAVAISGTVVSVEGKAVTIEISDADQYRSHRITLNDSQVTDTVTVKGAK
jgi:predicted thioesterase